MPDNIRGVFNILATPFDSTEQIDFVSLRHLVNFQIRMGAYGLTILGVLGEAAKLTVAERERVVGSVLEAGEGRVPVVVGTSHQETQTCIALSQSAFKAGAAAVMISPPRLTGSQEEKNAAVKAFYSEVAASVTQPIVVQDFPPVNDVIMPAAVLAELAETIPNVRHLKLEDPPLMQKITAIQALTDKYAIFGGLGGMFFLEELQRGAAGTMTGFAFTEILTAVYDAFQAGRRAVAETIFDQYLPLIRFENQPIINLPIRKLLLHLRGAIADPRLRPPYAPIDEGTKHEVELILRRVGIKDPTERLTIDIREARATRDMLDTKGIQ